MNVIVMNLPAISYQDSDYCGQPGIQANGVDYLETVF